MTKQEVISQVQSSLGSLFTKDDVINCLNMVEETPKVEPMAVNFPNKYWLDKIKNGILEAINGTDFNDSDNFEITDCEFSINRSNEVELDSYEVYATQLKDLVRDGIQDFFGEIEDEIIELQQDERLSSNEALKEAMEN